MEEQWKTINGYEGLYEVSNQGRVKSIGYGKERILKPLTNNNGYLLVNLHKDGKMTKCTIHRLVASAFIENPNNLPQVNHKDEDKTNNRVENLEWCSAEYNQNFGSRNTRIKYSMQNKPVFQYTKDLKLVKIYRSTIDTSRETGFKQGHISNCCLGKCKSAYNYIWSYKPLTNHSFELPLF